MKFFLTWEYILFSLIFILVFVVPVFPAEIRPRSYNAVFTLVYLSAALAVGREKRFFLWFALALMVFEWVSQIFGFFAVNEVVKSLSVLFFILIVVNFIIQIAKSKNVNARLILDAINGYLLLAIVFAIMVSLIMRADMQAFNFQLSTEASTYISVGFQEYMYFSLVTITTLGYGDISPQIPIAKSLATLMSVCGQFYVAILVALIVGKFASKMSDNESD